MCSFSHSVHVTHRTLKTTFLLAEVLLCTIRRTVCIHLLLLVGLARSCSQEIIN
jgi:hypothetical protein